MQLILRRFPVITIKPIPGCDDTHQFFFLPGLLIGRGFATFFWIRTMLTINFNTTLIKDD